MYFCIKNDNIYIHKESSRLERGLLVIIKHQTEELIAWMKKLKERFEANNPPEHMSDHTFFQQMKKETEPLFHLLNDWEKEVIAYIKNNHDINVYFPQIVATKENVEVLILHSYYVDIRRRLYMERYKSSLLIFEKILEEIERKEEL